MHRNFKFKILAIFIILLGLTVAAAYGEYVCGDANNDGGVNVSDAVYIINYVFIGGPAPDSTCCESGCPPTVTDADSNTYFTVKIGDQCWMAQNLKVTHYRSGDPVPEVTDAGQWSGLSSGAYCNYNNDETNVATYGRLYNWYTANDSRGIAPEGWHVPTDAELKQLEMYLGMSQAWADATGWRGVDEGGKLKEVGTTHWYSPNVGATNETSFTALAQGYRNDSGAFATMGYQGHFWSSTEYDMNSGWARYLNNTNPLIGRLNFIYRSGFAIRCIKD